MNNNLLLIHVDQLRYDCLGCHGHPWVQTPHLDRLAAEGMDFSNAFTPVPVCTPARASLLYGQWPSTHGILANADTELRARHVPQGPAFSQILSAAGYASAYVGKWSVHPTLAPTDVGFDTYTPESAYGAWRESQGLPGQVHENGFWGELDAGISPAQSRLAWGANEIIARMQALARGDAPWCLRWDPSEPHLPNILPEPFASMYAPNDIAPWPSFEDDFAGKPYIQKKQLETWGVQDGTWQDWAPSVSRYLGEISLLDQQVGRVLAALDATGQSARTVVVFTCDHGDMCGGHRMIDKHFVMYEDVVHVPLIIRAPAYIQHPGSHSDAFVCHELDLAATFCDMATGEVPLGYQGQSLLPLLAGGEGTRSDIFAAYHGNQLGLYTQRMLRNTRWKYVWNATAEDELYDLETDPAELHNRVRDVSAQATLQSLGQRMEAWMRQISDPALNAWTGPQLGRVSQI